MQQTTSGNFLNGAKLLITGGTGSFGKKFVKMTLEKHNPSKIVIFSRDEMKQWEMAKDFADDSRVVFFIGDVRDKDRLMRACRDIDFIVHAAALKIVPSLEYNPFEPVKTNIIGAMNIIDCAINQNVKRVVALSTDKACKPINIYGATKFCSDKLFTAGNVYSGMQDTRFSVVRYGNVMGSRGSIIPFFIQCAKQGVIPITDERMTRFMITLEQGVELVWLALADSRGGEIYVKKIPSMKVVDIAKAISENAQLKVVGIRPGEKINEDLITQEDAPFTYEYDTYYKVLSSIYNIKENDLRILNGKRCSEDFCYTSDANTEWMTSEQLKNWISKEYEYNPL
jgi:UDP-N-acetylglucosamine 4,6-dehydratase